MTTKLIKSGDGPNDQGLSRKHIVEGLGASLGRLQLEYVDIVFAHRPDEFTSLEETVRAMTHVIERGWALYWGTSEWSSETIRRAIAVAERLRLIPPVVEQPQYNLFVRDKVEREFASLTRDDGHGMTTWSPLKYGVLTGKYTHQSVSAALAAARNKKRSGDSQSTNQPNNNSNNNKNNNNKNNNDNKSSNSKNSNEQPNGGKNKNAPANSATSGKNNKNNQNKGGAGSNERQQSAVMSDSEMANRLAMDKFRKHCERLTTTQGRAELNKVQQLQTLINTEQLGCSLAQLALAWCLANRAVSSVIMGASTVAQLTENLGAIAVYKRLFEDPERPAQPSGTSGGSDASSDAASANASGETADDADESSAANANSKPQQKKKKKWQNNKKNQSTSGAGAAAAQNKEPVAEPRLRGFELLREIDRIVKSAPKLDDEAAWSRFSPN